jgi:hypothetical protein
MSRARPCQGQLPNTFCALILGLLQHYLPALNRVMPGHGLRLPSEAEREYACRAGTTSTCFHGEDPDGIWAYAW